MMYMVPVRPPFSNWLVVSSSENDAGSKSTKSQRCSPWMAATCQISTIPRCQENLVFTKPYQAFLLNIYQIYHMCIYIYILYIYIYTYIYILYIYILYIYILYIYILYIYIDTYWTHLNSIRPLWNPHLHPIIVAAKAPQVPDRQLGWDDESAMATGQPEAMDVVHRRGNVVIGRSNLSI